MNDIELKSHVKNQFYHGAANVEELFYELRSNGRQQIKFEKYKIMRDAIVSKVSSNMGGEIQWVWLYCAGTNTKCNS